MENLIPHLITILATSLMCALVKRPFRDNVAGLFSSGRRTWLLAVLPPLAYVGSTVPVGAFDGPKLLLLVSYFFLPVALTMAIPKTLDEVRLRDILIVAAIWLPIEFRLLDLHWLKFFGLNWPLGMTVITAYAFLLIAGRKSIELNCDYRIKRGDFPVLILAYSALFVAIVPLAASIGFVFFGIAPQATHNGWLLTAPLGFLAIFFGIALPEELLFRGYLQNTLVGKMGLNMGIVVTSVIFGLSHLDKAVKTSGGTFDVPNWWYVLFATVAGIGYGYIYHRRKSLLLSTGLHAAVDFTWIFFLRG